MTELEEYEALTAQAAAWTPLAVGQFEVSGPDAHAFVNRVVTLDIAALPPGRFGHGLLLRDDASIEGRITVYRFGDVVMLLVDEQYRRVMWQRLLDLKRGTVRLRDISSDVSVIVVRGPSAAARIATLLDPMPRTAGDLVTARLGGIDVFAARTTSDGPDGIDLYSRQRDLPALRQAIERLAIPFVSNATWELARLEWGVARVGIEIDRDDTPVEAALESLVAHTKGTRFPGSAAYASRLRSGPLKRLVGFRIEGGGELVPPIDAKVSLQDRVVDRVRSARLSPRCGIIGMTAVPAGSDLNGTPLVITSGVNRWQGRVAIPPFIGSADAPEPGAFG